MKFRFRQKFGWRYQNISSHPVGRRYLVPSSSARSSSDYGVLDVVRSGSPEGNSAIVSMSAIVMRDRFKQMLNISPCQHRAATGRISKDTGLQQDEGPGIVKALTFTARHDFQHGFVQALFSKADARDRLTGLPTPEAPRQIWHVLATVDKLPFHLVARGQYEEVGRKPLGDGFIAAPVREFRGAAIRRFESRGFDVGVNVLVASGYGGQTLETFALPSEVTPFERITGFLLRQHRTQTTQRDRMLQT